MKRRHALGVLAFAAAGAGSAADAPVRARFVGVWKLVSCQRTARDGQVAYPYGDKPVGRLTYDRAGRMSAQLMRPGRQPAPKGAAQPDGFLLTAAGFAAYYGTFDVDEKNKTVIHHVEASISPAAVGTDLKRAYEFSDNRLQLTVVSEAGVMKLVWERLPD